MPIIKTWDEALKLDPPPFKAELDLRAACDAGRPCVVGTGGVPSEATPDTEVRADILRYFILGGCPEHPVQGEGVQLQGAYVSGALNLNFAQARGRTDLANCFFAKRIQARQTRFAFLV